MILIRLIIILDQNYLPWTSALVREKHIKQTRIANFVILIAESKVNEFSGYARCLYSNAGNTNVIQTSVTEFESFTVLMLFNMI